MTWVSVISNGTAYTNGVALREMAQRNVEWYSVHANSVALREMARRNVAWYNVHVFAEHQTLLLNIQLLSITLNNSMLWRIVDLVYGVT